MIGVQKIGRYEVLNHLASGGMGQVYLARTTGLGGFERQVVVKTLDLSITDDDDAFVTMFLDEARLVGALHHQYIAPVYEVGCDDEGRYYLVMDYVNGETAEAVFRTSGEKSLAVPLEFAFTVVSCVASALEYAHKLRATDGTPLDIVHRDISLSNVMIGYDGAVKLIDFGIAKASNRVTKTQVGTLKGKIGYLAPEQVLRKDVDHRADIFALGIVLYELTTSTRAFREQSDLLTLERITSGQVRRPTEFVPNYPPELERIVLKALQIDPTLRYQDAGSLGRELERLAARMGLPLGHAAVTDVMKQLFSERRSRRRIARGSTDVKTDPSQPAISVEDEKTPITDVVAAVEAAVEAENRRAQRPTTPIVDPAKRAEQRQPLPLAAPGLPPTRVAQHTPQKLEVATPRVPTGPQLPAYLFRDAEADLAEAPTTIAQKPMAVSPSDPEPEGVPVIPRTRTPVPSLTPSHPVITLSTPRATSPSIPQPLAPRWSPSSFTHAVTSRVKPAISTALRTWYLLCLLFALAVASAIVIAVL